MRPPLDDLSGPTRTLIDELLSEQQRLQTPVARFSQVADRDPSAVPPVYRDLIPLSAPGPNEQYAFEVDLDSCTGCKACVAGCHSLNGLDDEETWRDVGTIFGGASRRPFQQTVTTACHHCADPGCLTGCPVLAYEKDPVTGIVRHLDDQCIGCQYCVLKCPYDVPKYSERLGIVRKCDLCHNRLSAGEAPACVQACPTQAIRVVTVKTFTTSEGTRVDTSDFLPATVAPAPDITYPTTRYLSRRGLPAAIAAADASVLAPQPPHWPLVWMLTLLPLAVGCFTIDAALPLHSPSLDRVGWCAALAGLLGSVAHLGQPWRAWRVFLGLRRSWLSREVIVFAVWFALATAETWLQPALPAATAALGLTGLWCSAMVYADTHRESWRLSQTAPRFFGSALILGFATAFAFVPSRFFAAALGACVVAKLAFETRALRILDSDTEELTPAMKTALLHQGPLRTATGARYVLAVMGGLAIPAALTFGGISGPARWVAWSAVFLAELAERYLFFRTVVAPKMPGVVAK
jgi:formate dehydrogenase iron-sulfur subunit